MSDLIDYISHFHGDSAGNQLEECFAFYDLPAPNRNEFIKTSDIGAIVFLEPYGLTFRITNQERYPHFENTHILQPLGSKPLGTVRLDINSGVTTFTLSESDIAKSHVRKLQRSLQKHGMDFYDDHIYNIGLVGSEDAPRPVVIDPGACKKMDDGSARTLLSQLWASAQCKVLGEIPESEDGDSNLRTSYSIATKKSDMSVFFDDCSKAKEDGLLKADWTTHPQYSHVSGFYRQRLGL